MSLAKTAVGPVGWLIAMIGSIAGLTQQAGALQAATRAATAFVENRGQWDLEARYVAQLPGQTVFLERGAVVLLSRRLDGSGHVVRLVIEGADEPCVPEGRSEVAGRYHFFYGNDPAGWQTNVRGFAQVVYRQLRPGVDMVVRVAGNNIKYDLLLEPRANLSEVILRAEGVAGLQVESDGSLVAMTSLGALRQPVPTTWEVDGAGNRNPVSCRYQLLHGERYAFSVDERRPDNTLVVDPGLEWSTFFGGSNQDEVNDVALGPDASVTIVGNTYSPDLPVTAGAFDPLFARGTGVNARDAFVCQLSAQGELIFCSYMGGDEVAGDFGTAVGLTENGEVTVSGWTLSRSFPITAGAFQTSLTGASDVFAARLTADGSSLLFSTFLGGSTAGVEFVERLHVLAAGDAILVGRVDGSDFPTTQGAFQTTASQSTANVFVTRLASSGSRLIYSTYLSSSGNDHVKDLAVTPGERVVVVGSTGATDFPFTSGAVQGPVNPTHPTNPFVTCLSADASSLCFSGSVGGSSSENARAVTLDAFGNIVIAGFTASIDFPVTGDAYDALGPIGILDDPDGYVAVVDPTGSQIVYGTYLGASFADNPDDVLVDSSGAYVVAGFTTGFDFPTTPGAFDQVVNPGNRMDLFVTRFAPDRRTLEYSTVLGGVNDEGDGSRVSIALDESGAVVVASDTRSPDYPTTPGALQTVYGGGFLIGVVSKLDLLPTGVRRYGSSTSGCEGGLVASVTALPQVGSTTFAATCTRAPPFSQHGLLSVSLASLDSAASASFAAQGVDPLGFVNVLPVSSDILGYSERPLRLPPVPGLEFHLQFFWPDRCASAGWSNSAALEVVVQP